MEDENEKLAAAAAAKKIADDALDQRLLAALQDLESTRHSNQAQTLFNIHNEAGWPRESGHTCGSCIGRVVDRVRGHLREKGLLKD